jgi:acyl carrier protein
MNFKHTLSYINDLFVYQIFLAWQDQGHRHPRVNEAEKQESGPCKDRWFAGKVGLAIGPINHYNSPHEPIVNMDFKDGKPMTREEITSEILNIFSREFEIEQPGLDKDLRETYEFDSVDAIELLLGIERFLKSELTHDEKKMAMGIRTINQIVDYVEGLVRVREREVHA